MAGETSGKIREAFRARGHDAWSCDFLPADDQSPYHLQCDMRDAILDDLWDLLIAHPTCTFLSRSGLHWNKRTPGRQEQTEQALDFVRWLMALPIVKVIENPIGCISTRIRKPDQIIQPWYFGHDASKATCLWIDKPLRKLSHTKIIEPRYVNGLPRWGNQHDSGQNSVPDRKGRWKERSETYSGVAEAMANQWSRVK